MRRFGGRLWWWRIHRSHQVGRFTGFTTASTSLGRTAVCRVSLRLARVSLGLARVSLGLARVSLGLARVSLGLARVRVRVN